jgi:hypothetical protein
MAIVQIPFLLVNAPPTRKRSLWQLIFGLNDQVT